MAQLMVINREPVSLEERQAIARYEAGVDHEKNPAIAFLSHFKGRSREVVVSRLRWVLRIAGLTEDEWSQIRALRKRADESSGKIPRAELAREFWSEMPMRPNVFTMDWCRIDRVFMEKVKMILVEDLAMGMSHASGVFSVMKGICTQSFEYEMMNERQYIRVQNTKNPRREWTPKDRYVQKDEVAELLLAARGQGDLKGLRDRALVSLLYACGLRRQEASGMCIEDIDMKKKSIRIFGKGDKERTIFPAQQVWNLLILWIREGLYIEEHEIRKVQSIPRDQRFNRYAPEGTARPVFVRILRGDKPCVSNKIMERLSGRGVEVVVKNLLNLAAFHEDDRITPHDFRAAFITRMLEEGHDMNTVRQMVGHEKITTTAGYDRRHQEVLRNAFQTFSVDGLE